MPKVNLSNRKFNRLTVLTYVGRDWLGNNLWLCCCECGKFKIIRGTSLKKKNTQSCGCLHKEKTSKINYKHGMYKSREYKSWGGSINRCYNLQNEEYVNYGGRGIAVCEEWRGSFEAFYRDMGERPRGTSLERIDVNGPYSRENCKWGTSEEQASNKRNNVLITHNGKTQNMKQWAKEMGFKYDTLWKRFNNKDWPLGDLFIPLLKPATRIRRST